MPQESEINQNSNEHGEELKILITGDKPKNLLPENSQANGLAYSNQMGDALENISEQALNQIIKDNPGKKIVLLSGLELGIEHAAARRALLLGVEVRAFVPYKDHGKNWAPENQKVYQELVAKIAEKGSVVHTSDKEYSPQRTELRDYRMVDEAQLILSLHDPGEKAAHQKTLDYAAKHSKPVINLWQEAERSLLALSEKFEHGREPDFTVKKNKVVIQNLSEKSAAGVTRALDLNNIRSENLRILSPSLLEVDALKKDGSEALAAYADRLRQDYKSNRNGLRDGMRSLCDALDKGEQITVACNCHSGGKMCHADVVKMAVEKINSHVKNQQIKESSRNTRGENKPRALQAEVNNASQKQENRINPRTQRAITEILSVSETDRLLEKINQTEGRNQSEQASYLGKLSHFVRDTYERGASVVDGKLFVPKENLSLPPLLAVTTQEFAVERIGEILKDETKAKELAPALIEYGNRIAGMTADGETKLKVFTWMYTALEGKGEFLKSDDGVLSNSREQKFGRALAEIRGLSEEMRELEPTDKIEFVQFNDLERNERGETVWENRDETSVLEEIYENAIERGEGEQFAQEQLASEAVQNLDEVGKAFAAEGFERIDLSGSAPKLPAEFTESELVRLLGETLPEIDRQLERGVPVKEVLKPFHENVRESAKDNALNRLETIYQKQRISELETKLLNSETSTAQKEKLVGDITRWQSLVLTSTREEMSEILANRQENNLKGKKTVAEFSGGKAGELSQIVKDKIGLLDVRRKNVIELSNPGEFRAAYEQGEKTFYEKIKTQIAALNVKIEEARDTKGNSGDKARENEIKKELSQLRELRPLFAFKLENSSEFVAGRASAKSLEERAFAASYVNYQLTQPDVRLRHTSDRYRQYAARLEAAATRDEVIKTSSEIRAENAALGLKWKDLEKGENAKQPPPLSRNEMQFLFTEMSPAHYTGEMTVAKLSYAHAGASRRSMTESLMRGEINASPEAQKLVRSLESRLLRRDVTDSLPATRHFFESLKLANENLKYKNDFCHREIYLKLPPQEKDYVYQKATRQKENLEYQLAYRQQKLIGAGLNHKENHELNPANSSQAEKSFRLLGAFYQARILGEQREVSPLNTKEISERDAKAAMILLKNQPPEKITSIGHELSRSESVGYRKIGEILETFGRGEVTTEKDGGKTIVTVKLPENALVEADTYRELLEKFYPGDAREAEAFRVSSFGEKTIEAARIKGQDETIKNWREEIGSYSYAGDTPALVLQTELALYENFSKIVELQQAARGARRENEKLLEKYSARALSKIQDQQPPVPFSIKEQKEIVAGALSARSGAAFAAGKTNSQFFQAVQKEITVGDFVRFTSNEKIIAENTIQIRNGFSEIAVKQNILEETRVKPSEIRPQDKLYDAYRETQKTEENRLVTRAAQTAFAENAAQDLEGKTIIDLVSKEEKDTIKTESADRARITLESVSKNFAGKEHDEQALKLAEAIDNAHELSKAGAPSIQVAAAFERAENEKAVLLQKAGGGIERPENKPLTLRLYEAEIQRAEKKLLAKSLGEKLGRLEKLPQNEKTFNLETVFSPEEREQIKRTAAEVAKERLEPKELGADHRKIPKDASRQAVATFKQLEQAHNVFWFSNDQPKIRDAFSRLDREAAALNKMRLDYTRAEKLAVLREGVKTDIADLLRKSPGDHGDNLVGQTSRILQENLKTAGFLKVAGDARTVNTLSRALSEKVESKQRTFTKGDSNAAVLSGQSWNKGGQNQFLDKAAAAGSGGKDLAPKNEPVRDAPLLSR